MNRDKYQKIIDLGSRYVHEKDASNLPVQSREAQDHLSQIFNTELPAVKESHDQDLLGLAEHLDPVGRVSRAVFERYDHIGATVIKSDPKVRDEFVRKDGNCEIGNVDLDLLRSFSIRRNQFSDGTVSYCIIRTDGGHDGGFVITFNRNGTVVIKNEDLETIDSKDERYQDALAQIFGLSNVIAKELSVAIPKKLKIHPKLPTGHDFINEITKKHKQENSVILKSLDFSKRIGNIAIKNYLWKLVSTNKKPDGKKMEFNERRVSPARIAALAALLPMPAFGLSDPWFEPASIAVAQGVVDQGYEVLDIGDNVDADKVRAWDGKNIDISDKYNLTSESQPILVLKPSQSIKDNAPVVEYSVGQTGDSSLGGKSPRILETDGPLLDGDCINIPLDGAYQGSDIAIAAVDNKSAEDLVARQSKDGLKICNTSPIAFSIGDRNFIVDVKGKDR